MGIGTSERGVGGTHVANRNPLETFVPVGSRICGNFAPVNPRAEIFPRPV